MTRFIILGFLSIQALHADELVVENRPAFDPYRVFWSNDDQWLISKSRRGEVRVWQTDTGLMTQVMAPIGSMESKLTFNAAGTLAAFSRDGHAVVIDRRTGKEMWRSEENEIYAMGPLTDTHLTYATLSGLHRSDHRQNLKAGGWKWKSETYCRDILPLADGCIAAVMANRDVVILNASTLAETSRIAGTAKRPFYFAKSAAKGSLLALCAFDGIFLGDAKKPGDGFRRLVLPGVTFSIAISATGERLAINSGSEIQIRSVATNEVILSTACARAINDMAWSDDGSKLAIATADQGISIIDTKTGELIRSFGEFLFFGTNCAVSPNGRLVALWAEDQGLTIIDLQDMTAVLREPDPKITPEWMAFTDARTLIAATNGSCYRFDDKGVLLGRLRPEGNALGFQMVGPDTLAFRTTTEVIFYEWRANQPEEIARHPMKIVRTHATTHSDSFSIARDGEEAGPLTIRMGPKWNKKAEVPPPVSDPSVGSAISHSRGNALSWLDKANCLVSFSIPTGKLDVLRKFPETLALRSLTTPSSPEWSVISWEASLSGKMDYEVVSAISGETIHRSKPWEAFLDEVDCIPVGVSPDRKHLWVSGSAGHPILVDLESGQPLLRIQTWNDGGVLFEKPGGRFAGNAAGLARIQNVSDDLKASKPQDERLAAALDTRGIRAILSRVLTVE